MEILNVLNIELEIKIRIHVYFVYLLQITY